MLLGAGDKRVELDDRLHHHVLLTDQYHGHLGGLYATAEEGAEGDRRPQLVI